MKEIPSSEEQIPHDPILDATILNPNKEEREADFEKAWQERYDQHSKKGYFQTKDEESPFSAYSSRGWKVHIAFKKGEEKRVAQLLYQNSLYFKLESQAGTYFNGNVSSGATIYIGSNENMKAIAEEINTSLGDFLEEGAYVESGKNKIPVGSDTDIPVLPKIMARFDVAKTQYGYKEGNGKYSEHGLPTWLGLGGLPILNKYEKEVNEVLDKWNKLQPSQRKIYHEHFFTRIYNKSKAELVKDFGEEFVLGRKV